MALALLLAGCGNLTTNGAGNTFIPNTDITLGPSTTITLEKLVYWGGVGAIAYYITDPMSPNWEIQEAKFPRDHYRLSLKMKRYYTGGAGEARMVFNRRARELANTGGFAGYQIVEYSEGLDSSVIGSQRIAEGVIVLTGPVASGAAKTATP